MRRKQSVNPLYCLSNEICLLACCTCSSNLTRSIGATVVLAMAAVMPPARKSLMKELASSITVVYRVEAGAGEQWAQSPVEVIRATGWAPMARRWSWWDQSSFPLWWGHCLPLWLACSWAHCDRIWWLMAGANRSTSQIILFDCWVIPRIISTRHVLHELYPDFLVSNF